MLVPEGKKRLKNLSPCFLKQIIFMPKNKMQLNVKVTIKWLVAVKLNGINPIKFRFINNKKITRIIGKNCSELRDFMLSDIKENTVLIIISIIICILVGTKKISSVLFEEILLNNLFKK